MKRVALFMPTLGGGGAERVMIQLAGKLADEGMTVALVVASSEGVLRTEVSTNVELVDLGAGRVMNAIMPLAAWLSGWRPHALIACQVHANVVAYLAHRRSGIDCRLILREVSTPSVNMKSVGLVMRILLWFLMRWAYVRADTVVAVSHGVAEDLRRYLRADLPRLRVIYNPVVDDGLYVKAEQPIDHPWFSHDESVPVVLAVGRLTEAKNYKLLIRAFSFVVKERKARLLILGEGEERPALQRLIQSLGLSECVLLPGFDSNPYRYMRRCSVYVMSSQWEGLPGVLIQALALKASIVATDCKSGPSEILAEGRFGRLVPVGEPDALSRAMLQAMDERVWKENALASEWRNHIGRFRSEFVVCDYMSLLMVNERTG